MSHVVLRSNGTPEGTHVLIDGQEATSVISLRLEVGARERAVLTVELYVDEIDVTGEITTKFETISKV